MSKRHPISAPLGNVFVSFFRSVLVAGRAILAPLMLFASVFASPDVLAEPTAEEVLAELPLTDRQRQAIWRGEIVTMTTPEPGETGLPVGVVMLVRKSPDVIPELFHEASVYKAIPLVTANGRVTDKGSLADFEGVKLEPNGEQEAKRYLEAAPGVQLNLDQKEIASFRALNAQGENAAALQKEVEALVRSNLLARYRAYLAGGLSGIAPYARARGQLFDPGEELRKRIEIYGVVSKFYPSFHNFLLKYPAAQLPGLVEQFFWLNLEVFGRPTFALSHRVIYKHGAAYLVGERHFYASHDYNSLQMVAAGLPTKDGTLVSALYRVSTQQVAGLGSSVKKPVARRLMQTPLSNLAETVRKKAEKR